MEFGQPLQLNSATLLPETFDEPVLHTCQDVLAEEMGIRQDLQDQPLNHSEVTWFTDESSFLLNGKRRAGATAVSVNEVIWTAR